jgi:hypothetical protein
MEKVLLLAFIICFLFFLVKLAESQYIEKKQKPLKILIRDSVFAFGCSFITLLVYFQFDEKIGNIFEQDATAAASSMKASNIFTDEPGF